MSPHQKERHAGKLLLDATDEIDRLIGICTHVHDRMLRGEDELTLMRALRAGWQGPERRNSRTGDQKPMNNPDVTEQPTAPTPVACSDLLADIQRVSQWACCCEPEARVRAEHSEKQLHAELRRTKWALEYCLRTLKHHHMTKPGIAATVEETERRMRLTMY